MPAAAAAVLLSISPVLAQEGGAYGRFGAPLWVWIASAGITVGAMALGGAIGWWFHRRRARNLRD